MQLRTARTFITPISENDFSEILEMYNEPDSFKFITPLLDKDDAFYLEFLKGKVETNKSILGFWTVRDRTTNNFIGTVNLNQFKNSEIIHIGSHLSNKFWNKGFSTELLPALIDYGFNVRKLEYINAILSIDHIVSKKLLTKLGFEFFEEFEIEGEVLHLYRIRSGK